MRGKKITKGGGMRKPMMKPMMKKRTVAKVNGGYANQVIAPTYTYRFRFAGGTLGQCLGLTIFNNQISYQTHTEQGFDN